MSSHLVITDDVYGLVLVADNITIKHYT